MTYFSILQIILILALPYLLTRLTERLGTANILSPVVLCYLAGIALRTLTALPIDDEVCNGFSHGAIVLAIPLLLYSTDLVGWLKLAKSTILAWVLVVISVTISSLTMGFMFRNQLDNIPQLSGMLTGVFVGTTANLFAVGRALGTPDEIIIGLNAVEMAVGAVFLIFLTSVAHRFFGLFLPDFKGDKHAGEVEFLLQGKFGWQHIGLAMALTVLLAGAAASLTFFIVGKPQEHEGFFLLCLTALAVGASLSPRIRALPGAYETGEYCLLMFCLAIGMLADFTKIFSTGGSMLALTVATLLFSVGLHTLFCRLFRIDRDTMMITNTAAIYGPPFIGQVAAIIKNRSLVFSGIATALVGIASANFIGAMVGKLLAMWLGK